MQRGLPLFTACFTGISASALVATPLGVWKRRRQTVSVVSSRTLRVNEWLRLYLVILALTFPKTLMKYWIYEPLFSHLSRQLHPSASASGHP